MRLRDLTGERYGRLTCTSHHEMISGRAMWTCRCDCGAEVVVRGGHMTGGRTLSCGCAKSVITSFLSRTHGMSKTRPYRIWRNMINRCHNLKWPERHLYGGRGIVVCQRWRESFVAFWDDMSPTYQPHLSIDRMDTNGNYEPGNCRWADDFEQAQNRRPPRKRKEVHA